MNTKFEVLQNRDLRILGVSALISGVGSWITMMAVLALLVFKGTGGVDQSSGIFLAGLLPTMLLSPLAGWLSDRFDRRLLMALSQFLSAGAIAGLVFARSTAAIYALLALEAAFVSLLVPARQSALPEVVGEAQLVKANAFMQQLNGILKILAPMLAGSLLAVLDPHQAIAVNVVSYLISGFLLLRLSPLPPAAKSPASGAETAARFSLLDAVRAIPALKLIFLLAFFAIFLLMGLDVVAPVFIRDALGRDEQYYGVMIGLIGAGTLAASFLLMVRGEQKNLWRGMIVGLLLLACIPAAMVLAPSLRAALLASGVILAGSLLGGVGSGLSAVQRGTLVQLLSPREMLGRITGLFESVMVVGQLLGVLATPLLVPAVFSMQNYLLLMAALLVVLAGFAAWFVRRLPAQPALQTAPAMPVDLG